MNYIWEIIVAAKQEEKDIKKIKFKPAEIFSPYMELSRENLNLVETDGEIEINPYYRFCDIFKDLFKLEYDEFIELREVLFDITVHFLAEIDITQGMNRDEYYKKFILKDIESGVLGQVIKEGFYILSKKEKKKITFYFYKMSISGNMFLYLKKAIKSLFKNANIYISKSNKNEIMFFLNCEKKLEEIKKIEMIKEMFLPIGFTTVEYWDNHFGVIGVEESMKIEKISIY